MAEPEVSREDPFVRRAGAAFEVARFTRLDDGSAIVIQKGYIPGGCEGGPDAWRQALRRLQRAGFVELSDALRRGLLTKDEADALLG